MRPSPGASKWAIDGSSRPPWRFDRGRALITLLLLVGVAVVAWRFVAPGEQFLPEFGRILAAPTVQRGVFSVLSGRSYALGKFENRDVAVRLQLKRSRHGQGYLVVAIRTGGEPDLDYSGVEARARDAAGRLALCRIAAHDLLPAVEGGWLKARWKPQGFVIFPGRFSEQKWREVLAALHVLATSLEAAA